MLNLSKMKENWLHTASRNATMTANAVRANNQTLFVNW